MSVRLLEGDCRAILPTLDVESVDAVVTDPPYDLLQTSRNGSGRSNEPENPYGRHGSRGGGFMGLSWDATGVAFTPETWHLCARVMKPGAHLVAFGGPRTFHRMTCAIEDAGFEIRDCLCWLFGSGFPKSHNLPGGLGTALKPAWEPIILARKPLVGTVAANVERYGTGALNIDGCRIEGGERPARLNVEKRQVKTGVYQEGKGSGYAVGETTLGRWPANVVLDEETAALLDAQTGDLSVTGVRSPRSQGRDVPGTLWGNTNHKSVEYPGDTGGASRFFYVAKASRAERNAGLAGMPERNVHPPEPNGRAWDIPGTHSTPRANHHPTVKPVDLMRWLVRLVTPPAGIVLDPFMGSGTTGIACVCEERGFIGVEREAEYLEIARRRIAHWQGPLFALAGVSV